MNNIFSDRLNMFNAVLAVCDRYPEAVESIPALASGIAILRERNIELHKKLAIQTQSSTVLLTQTKNERRDRAIATSVNLAKRIRSASKRLNDPMMVDQLLFTVSAMRNLTEKEQLFRLLAVANRIETNIVALKDWNIAAETLTAFRAEVDAFQNFSGGPVNRIIERSTITQSLQNKLQEVFDFVREDLQLIVETIEDAAHATFSNQALRAMRVRLTGNSSTDGSIDETPIDTRDEAVKEADLRNQERTAAAPPAAKTPKSKSETAPPANEKKQKRAVEMSA